MILVFENAPGRRARFQVLKIWALREKIQKYEKERKP